jgi:hypothetical protein
MKSRLAAGLLLVLSGMSFADSLVLGGVAPAGPTQKSRMPMKYLQASLGSQSSVLLVWRLGVRPDLQWVSTEIYNILLKQWTHLDVVYVGNEATRYEHGGLQGSTQYRFQVCGYVKEASGKVLRYCTDQKSVQIPRVRDFKEVLTLPVQFTIGGLTPARAGFQPCTGITGYIGKVIDYRIVSSNWTNSLCAAGNVTITQTNSRVNMLGKKVRLIVTGVAYAESYGTSSNQTDVYEMAYSNPTDVTFQVALASGIGPFPSHLSYSEHDLLTNALSYGPAVKITVEYQGTKYGTLSCTYKTSPVALSCQ